MTTLAKKMISALPALALSFVCYGTAYAGDAHPSVTADTGAYKALGMGDYEKSRNDFQAAYEQSPRDPYLQLDLGAAYQNLGRQDLADALYRKAMVDGKDIRPKFTTFERDKGRTIAEIACENIGIGNNTGACSPIAMN